MTYQGHLPDGSSVQKHSAGDIYPYVVQVRDRAPGAYHWELLGPGLQLPSGAPLVLRFESHDDLHRAALRLLAVRENADAWSFELERVCTSGGARLRNPITFTGNATWADLSQVQRVASLLAAGMHRAVTLGVVNLHTRSTFVWLACCARVAS